MTLENPAAMVDAEAQKLQAERKKRLEKMKSSGDENLSAEDLELRKSEIYENGDEGNVGAGEFEYRKASGKGGSASEKNTSANGDEGLSPEDLELRKKEIYQEGDNYVEDHVGSGQSEFRVTPEKNAEYQAKDGGDNKKLNPEDIPGKNAKMGREFGVKEPVPASGVETWADLKKKDLAPVPGKVNEAKENQEKLAELNSAVENARKAYANNDYKVTDAYSKITRVLGKFFKKEPKENPENQAYLQKYKDALEKLKEFRLNELRNKYKALEENTTMAPEEKAKKAQELNTEMGCFAKYFNYGEKIKLYEDRTNAGAEARKDTLTGKVMAVGAELVNKYRKLNWKTKLALSLSLMAGSLYFAGAGMATLATIGAVQLGQKVLGGASVGMSTSGLIEMLNRKKQREQSDKDAAEMVAGLEGAGDWQTKFSAYENKLSDEMKTYDSALQRERGSADLRVLSGIAAGTLVGSGAAFHMLKWGFGAAVDGLGFGHSAPDVHLASSVDQQMDAYGAPTGYDHATEALNSKFGDNPEFGPRQCPGGAPVENFPHDVPAPDDVHLAGSVDQQLDAYGTPIGHDHATEALNSKFGDNPPFGPRQFPGGTPGGDFPHDVPAPDDVHLAGDVDQELAAHGAPDGHDYATEALKNKFGDNPEFGPRQFPGGAPGGHFPEDIPASDEVHLAGTVDDQLNDYGAPDGAGSHGSAVENGLRDDPSSKLGSKVGGMYDDIHDKAKGAWNNFEKNQLNGTPPTPELDPNISETAIHGSVERTTIDKLVSEYNIPKPQAQRLAHIMAENYAKEKGIPFDDLNHVQPNDVLKFNIDPNNIADSKIIELDRASGLSGHFHGGGGIHNGPDVAGHGAAAPEVHAGNPVITAEEGSPDGIDDAQGPDGAEQFNSPQEYASGRSGSEILGNIHSMPEYAQALEGKMLHVGELKQLAQQAYDRAIADTNDVTGMRAQDLADANKAYLTAYNDVYSKVARETFYDSGIDRMGLNNMSAMEFLGPNGDGGGDQKIADLSRYVADHFGEKVVQPKIGETMNDWSHRVIGKALESGGAEFKNYGADLAAVKNASGR